MSFFVMEGIDGAGKTSAAEAVRRWLESKGHHVVLLREPGSTPVGERVRKILLDPEVGDLEPWTEACLFTACRAEMVPTLIKPALDDGRIVILDRYFYSTVAYQGFAGSADVDLLMRLSLEAVQGLQPDQVFLLDLPAQVGIGRLAGSHDRVEGRGEAYLERVREGYLELARRDPERWHILDATEPEDAVALAVMGFLSRRLNVEL